MRPGPARPPAPRRSAGRLRAGRPLTLAQTINATLTDALLATPGAILFGQDVAAKAACTASRRTCGTASAPTGCSTPCWTRRPSWASGSAPGWPACCPYRRSYLAYLHNAEDQLRGEAATLGFFSQQAFRNRSSSGWPGWRTSRASGATSTTTTRGRAARRTGLVLAVPARAAGRRADAARVPGRGGGRRQRLRLPGADRALPHPRPVRAGDNEWLAPYAGPKEWASGHAPIGRARTYPVGAADNLTILTFGNGVPMSLRVAARLAEQGYGSRVVDLRWLSPLPTADLVREASATGRVC
ncbi:hypothetical protein GCM10020358_24350 [Amorphoplanes nipponensis]